MGPCDDSQIDEQGKGGRVTSALAFSRCSMIERRVSESMDTRKRNLLIGLGASIVVIIAALVVLMALGGNANQDEAVSGSAATAASSSAATAASDAASASAGTLHSSGDGTADNQVDAFEVYGDSADGAAVSGGATSSVSGSGVVSGDQPDGAGSSDSGSAGSGESDFAGNGEPAGGADPGVKTEADGSKWTGYY